MDSRLSRRAQARKIRYDAADFAYLREQFVNRNNGDEAAYPNYIANYTKGFPHDALGEVDREAYGALLRALASGNPSDFATLPLTPGSRKLVNPQAGLGFDLEGPDGHSLAIPPAPRLASAQVAAEMGELYWMALLRDVHFKYLDRQDTEGDDSAKQLVADAALSLSKEFSDFRGPKDGGQVTPATLFRGMTPGDRVGPYVSQFLLMGNRDDGLSLRESQGFITYGTLKIDQRQRTAACHVDFMTDYDEWRAIQNGLPPQKKDVFDSCRRFIRNPRDLAAYVHFDQLYEAYLNACLLLLEMRAPVDRGNPYACSCTEDGFGTFGGPHILSLVCEVASRALKAVWYQKWFVHRRLRPEAFGGLVHNHRLERAFYPIQADLLNSVVLDKVHAAHGTYLLPQAFPEGSPMHPAYGAGHATVAGACVTLLKAWFDEAFVLPQAFIANDAGTELLAYSGPDAGKLTVGGELNKLAANISIGRNMGGVHWLTDYEASVRLGEAIAIGLLQEQKATYNEDSSLTLTKFDGSTIAI